MTTIAYKDGIFAWDSQRTNGYMTTYTDGKVFTNGPLVIGVAGRARFNNILRYMKVPDMPTWDPDWNLEKWINSVFIPSLIKEAKQFGFDDDSDGVISSNMYLMHVEGRCFRMSSDFFFDEVQGPFAIGSGSAFAIGAMKHGASAEESVEIAKYFDPGTGGKVHSKNVNL